MFRSRRSVALFIVFMLIFGSFAAVQRPSTAHAAGPFVVTTTRDLTGSTCGTPCSLRQALNAAIAAGGNSTIAFNIATTESPGVPMPGYVSERSGLARTWTITPTAALPIILNVNGIIIDGTSQAGSVGGGGGNPNLFGPEIIIDGSLVTTRGGLTIVNGNDNK